jgi:hypothetical protein
MHRELLPVRRLTRPLWQRDAAAMPYHGLLMFLSQILLVLWFHCSIAASDRRRCR